MIIVRLNGGLGNQMFQYITGKMLALHNNDILKLDVTGYTDSRTHSSDIKRNYSLDNFKIEAEIATAEEIEKLKNPLKIFSKVYRFYNKKILRKYYLDYHPEIFSWKGNIYLDGYFQCEKYFSDKRSIVQENFSLKNQLSNTALELKSLIENTPNSISLHIRRGDYFSNPKTNIDFGMCSIQYYEQAFKILSENVTNPHVFLFSDDIEWVKENLKLPVAMTPISRPGLKDFEELYLMSLCKDNIISNSSFSWWAAWLNKNPEKKVVSPKTWVKNPKHHPNIHPPSWIKI